MKHSTILVPVKCSDRLPEKEKNYHTDLGELVFMWNAILKGWYFIGQTHKYGEACPDFWYEEQYDKIVLSDPGEEHIKITGFSTIEEWVAYEKGRQDEQRVMIDFIKNWDGSNGSAFGKVILEKFKELK